MGSTQKDAVFNHRSPTVYGCRVETLAPY